MGGLDRAFTEEAAWEATIPAELAHIELGRGFRFDGRAAIRAGLVQVLEQDVSPIAVKLESATRASSRSTLRERLRIHATGTTLELAGTYFDTLVKEDGAWRFARRSFRLRHAKRARRRRTRGVRFGL